MVLRFAPPFSAKNEQEDSVEFAPFFDDRGLITAVATDAHTGEILMLAYMNEESLRLTLETGIAHYWSRSRNKLWKKGETSGNLQQVKEIRTDCDQDALWLKVQVDGHGATCHTGRNSCFYRRILVDNEKAVLEVDGKERLFDPSMIYNKG